MFWENELLSWLRQRHQNKAKATHELDIFVRPFYPWSKVAALYMPLHFCVFFLRWGIPTTKFRSKFISIKSKAQFCFKRKSNGSPRVRNLFRSCSHFPRHQLPPFLLRGTGFPNCVNYNRTRIVYTRNIVQGRREGGREGRRTLACNGFPRSVIVSLCGTGEFFLKKSNHRRFRAARW